MANSITSGGTSRTILGLFTSDIDTSGDITATSFAGSGAKITKLNATNITSGLLSTIYGGTGNNNYANNGLTYYYNNKLVNNTNLQWIGNALIINNRDFQSDTSNYVKNTSNNLINIIYGANNILETQSTNNSNYVFTTSNILVNYINTVKTNNVSLPARTNRLGSVKIGDGIYVNKEGAISVMPEIIYMNSPTLNNLDTSLPIPDTDYKIYKFIYNPLIGTSFDRQNQIANILPIWFQFIDDNLTNNSIKNNGYESNLLTNLELYGATTIKPTPATKINIEYTPLNTTYLEVNGVSGTPTYCKFEADFNLLNIFRANNIYKTDWALTISFWLKVNSSNNEIIILDCNNNEFLGTNRIFNIHYVDNKLIFYINVIAPYFTILNINNKIWYHVVWSIEKIDTKFKVLVYIDGVERGFKNEENDFLFFVSFNNFINNSISSLNNTNYTYNFCISDFKIYSKALNIIEINELYYANNYTQYIIDFNNEETICDIIAYGGGGGGSGGGSGGSGLSGSMTSNYGGGAGKLIYVNDAYIPPGSKTLRVGRGGIGYYQDLNFNQISTIGNNTSFENLIADGGGTSSNYNNINNIYIINQNIGGCGSGNYGGKTPFNITNDIYNLFGGTSNIYYFGNAGGQYGGGGIGSVGNFLNGGTGFFELSGLVNNNITVVDDVNTLRYFNFNNSINFKTHFNLVNDNIGELYNGNIYIGCGGAGNSNINNVEVIGEQQLGYNSINSGCGGKFGENGKNGGFFLRFLTKMGDRILPKYIQETSNYVVESSNNIINYVNNITSVNGQSLWTISNNNLNYNIGNVGIGIEPTNYKLEVAVGQGTTGAITNRYFNVSDGVITSVIITSGGSGYSNPPTVSFTGGGGSGGTGNVVVSDDAITSVSITSGGSGYTSPPTVSFVGGNGATGTAVVTGGIITSVIITAGGSGYSNPPTISFAGGGGSGATGNVVVSGGIIRSVSLTSGGSGYSSPPTASFVGGSGATGTVVLTGAVITSLTITSGGSGYSNPPTISFTGGGGNGGAGNVIVSNGAITSVRITSGGIGYTSPPAVSFVGGNGATGTAVLTGGVITSVIITAGGNGYSNPPTISFAGGGGNGANGNVIVSNGVITSVIITSGGSGYTSLPTMVFVGGSGATCTAFISNLITSAVAINDVCTKFNSSIWIAGGGSVIASSDKRIKEDIQDINDGSALNMILAIEPKTYKYIDKVIKGDCKVYGFIAQQIKEVIADAVKIQTEFIPNIFSVADYDYINNILTLPLTLPFETINIRENTMIKCIDMNNNVIVVEIVKIININTFKIKKIDYRYNKIFVYGIEVNDFHALNKEYINTLNVCAVQELHRKIVLQQNQINDLTEKINLLINYFDLSKITSLEEEINAMKSRMDTIISCIDLPI